MPASHTLAAPPPAASGSTPRAQPSSAAPSGALRRILWGNLALGSSLIRQLRMPWKLGLISASMLIPLFIIMVVGLQKSQADYRYAETELQGLELLKRALPLAVAAQSTQGLLQRQQAGDSSLDNTLREHRDKLQQSLGALDQGLAAQPELILADFWQPLRSQLVLLATGRPAAGGDTIAAIRSESQSGPTGEGSAQMLQLMQVIGERSGLVLDPEARSYLLMDLLVNQAVPLHEALMGSRDLGTSLLKSGTAQDAQRSSLPALISNLKREIAATQFKLAALERAGGKAPPSWGLAREVLDRFVLQSSHIFSGDATPYGSSAAYATLGNEAQARVEDFENVLAHLLQQEIVQRQQTIQADLHLLLGSFGAGLVALAYLLTCFYLSFNGSLQALRRGMAAVAAGDLSASVAVQGKDELREIGQLIDTMTYRLSALVAEIRSSATQVDLAGSQVAEGSTKLSLRTEHQASSLRNSVDNIEQLSLAVASNAESASELDQLARTLREQAEAGNATMEETVASFARMQESSIRVSEAVAVIDDVAFQTSMLSLNATVEAARAGEAGKGFAVVASEVRQLAQRCADSAEEIRRLIGDSDEQMRQSTAMIGTVSASLKTIVVGVQDVSEQLRAISAASAQQSKGLEDVTVSVGNLDEITRENAGLVQESNEASSVLLARAQALHEAVATMRLRHGSADEALAMVNKAKAHLALVGTQRALVDFHRADGGYIDRDLYLFAFDRNGVFSINGSNPDLVGQRVQQVPGLEVSSFADDAWRCADAGGGWVSYEVMHPLTGEIRAKESYILPLGPNELLGCGCYKANVGKPAEPSAAR